jgi:DNA-binding response OmpR family regulator
MGKRERILVVDDDGDARETLATALTQAGYAVEIVGGGDEALERMRTLPADAVVSDVWMPDMSGLDLIRALRHKGFPQPVVLITGLESDLCTAATAYGATSCLKKPFALDELVWAIDCALACKQERVDPRAPTQRAPQRRAQLRPRYQ